MVLHCFYRP